MTHRPLTLLAVLFLSLLPLGLPVPAGDPPDGWVPLFNGKDLDGWDTWLGRPFADLPAKQLKKLASVADLPAEKRQEIEKQLNHLTKLLDQPIGLNRDPTKVYTIAQADGTSAIRVSGEFFGAITTKKEFENYHLKLDFKWGTKKWTPRETVVRDSGLLYHCVGPHGAAGTFWMRSQELQIQEKDCGDYWSVAGGIVDVEAEMVGKSLVYKKGAKKWTVPSKETGPRIIKSPDSEKPSGQWNTIELLTVGPTSVHIVNGTINMILTGSRQMVDGKEVPLTKGKIQLQSEGAEVFYRNISIRPISTIPEKYLK